MERLMLWRSSSSSNKKKITTTLAVDDADLSSWEIINPSDDDETLSFSDERPGSIQDNDFEDETERPRFIEDNTETERPGFDHPIAHLGHTAAVVSELSPDDQILTDRSCFDRRWGFIGDLRDNKVDDQIQDERLRSSDDDGVDGDYDYDENLVPYSVSNRFGKQRLGKVGKKLNSGMMKKSKKMPRYYYKK